MSAVSLTLVCLLAAMAAFGIALALSRAGHRHRRALDDTWDEPQKLHRLAVPRIGGLAIAAGVVGGAAAAQLAFGGLGAFWLLLVCMIPGFAWGLIEDFSKRGAVFARLVLTGMTPMLAYVVLDARITAVGVPGLDSLLAVHAFSFLFTVFAVTGIAHAINVVDGLNGLAGVTSLLAALGLAVVAWTVGDTVVFCGSLVLGAAVAGFLLVNYPGGRLFLGDGGAYFIGLVLALLSVMLVERNAEVSPWLPLMLLAYPIWETIFSMLRRRLRGRSLGSADALHLHSLVYRRIVRWDANECVTRNSLASALLWIIPAACWPVAVLLWDETRALQAAAALFIVAYGIAYRRIVRFRVPAWLVIRRGARAAAALEAEDVVHAAERP